MYVNFCLRARRMLLITLLFFYCCRCSTGLHYPKFPKTKHELDKGDYHRVTSNQTIPDDGEHKWHITFDKDNRLLISLEGPNDKKVYIYGVIMNKEKLEFDFVVKVEKAKFPSGQEDKSCKELIEQYVEMPPEDECGRNWSDDESKDGTFQFKCNKWENHVRKLDDNTYLTTGSIWTNEHYEGFPCQITMRFPKGYQFLITKKDHPESTDNDKSSTAKYKTDESTDEKTSFGGCILMWPFILLWALGIGLLIGLIAVVVLGILLLRRRKRKLKEESRMASNLPKTALTPTKKQHTKFQERSKGVVSRPGATSLTAGFPTLLTDGTMRDAQPIPSRMPTSRITKASGKTAKTSKARGKLSKSAITTTKAGGKMKTAKEKGKAGIISKSVAVSKHAGATSRAGTTYETTGRTTSRAGTTSETTGGTTSRAGTTSETTGATTEAGTTTTRATSRAAVTTPDTTETTSRAGTTYETTGTGSKKTSGASNTKKTDDTYEQL